MKTEKKLPVISIVVPSYNQGQYIGETLDSLVSQNYPSLEIIVMDGGSTDNSVQVIRSFEKHLKYWVSEKDNGQSDAINKGFRFVTGDLFNWLNSDDQLEKNALHSISDLYLSKPDYKMYCGRTIFYGHGNKEQISGPILFGDQETTMGFGQINQPAMYYRRDVFSELGMLREDLHMCMDLDYWLRFLSKYNISCVANTNDIWIRFRMHPESKNSRMEQLYLEEKDRLYAELEKRLSQEKGTSEKISYDKIMNYRYLWEADAMQIIGKKKEAAELIRKVKPVSLSLSELRRYLAVRKILLFQSFSGK